MRELKRSEKASAPAAGSVDAAAAALTCTFRLSRKEVEMEAAVMASALLRRTHAG